MKQFIYFVIISVCFTFNLAAGVAYGLEQRVIQANGLQFWTETFGDNQRPAILLVMGNAGQSILWPQQFCEQLANKGYFVIRYDHRDVGLSSPVDYAKNPYNLLDMAKDAISICDYYGIKKVNVVGASMGGEIAMIMGAHFPDRINSLTLMMTSTDMSVGLAALQDQPSNSTLSKPNPEYIAWLKNMMANPKSTVEGQVSQYIEGVRLANGSKIPLDEELIHQLVMQMFARMRYPTNQKNHFLAIQASYALHSEAPSKIKVPTLILHGDQDPIFPVDHAYAIQKAIPHSKLAIVPGMGHTVHTPFFNIIIESIDNVAKMST